MYGPIIRAIKESIAGKIISVTENGTWIKENEVSICKENGELLILVIISLEIEKLIFFSLIKRLHLCPDILIVLGNHICVEGSYKFVDKRLVGIMHSTSASFPPPLSLFLLIFLPIGIRQVDLPHNF